MASKRVLRVLLFPLLASSCMPGEGCRVVGDPVALDDSVREASGVVFSRQHRNVLWLHNDSDAGPTLFAIDVDGTPLGRATLTGAQNRDWEDVSIGRCPDDVADGDCLFVADIGDNRATREGVGLWVAPEPDPRANQSVPATFFRLRYPGGARDAEALAVLDDGSFIIVSKGREHPVVVYSGGPLSKADANGDGVELRRVQQFTDGPVELPRQITGAGTDGSTIALRSYASLQFYRIDADTLAPLLLAPVPLDTIARGEPQGEGVALGSRGRVFLVSEAGPQGIAPRLTRLRCRRP